MSARNWMLIAALLALGATAWLLAVEVVGGRPTAAHVPQFAKTASEGTPTEAIGLSAASRPSGSTRTEATEAAGAPDAPSAPHAARSHTCTVIVERDDPRGALVEGARVRVSSNTLDGSSRTTVERQTDAHGALTFETPGTMVLVVHAEREIDGKLWRGSGSYSVRSSTSEVLRVPISAAPPRTLDLLVLDRDTLAPIADARVRSPIVDGEVHTDSTGRCTLAVTDPSLFALRFVVRSPAYFPMLKGANLPLAESSDSGGRFLRRKSPSRAVEAGTPEHVVRLCPAARLEGYVLDSSGAPLPDAEIRVVLRPTTSSSAIDSEIIAPEPLQAKADERGGFAVPCVPAGMALELAVRSRGESVQCDGEHLVLERGEARSMVLRMRGHLELTGRVLDLDDRPLAGGKIRIDVGGKSDAGSIRSDGTYYLPFAVAGSGWVTVSRAGEEEEEEQHLPVTIPTGIREWTCDLRLTATTTIAGRFVDADDRPMSGIMQLTQPDCPAQETIADGPEGSFEFRGVRPGVYTLLGLADDARVRARRNASHLANLRASTPQTVRAGDRNLIVRMPACGVLRGRVVDPSGRPASRAFVFVLRGEEGLGVDVGADGTFECRVEAGRASVWVDDSHRRSRPIEVELTAGQETNVGDLEVVPCGTLLLATGLEPAGLRCAVRTDTATWFEGLLSSRATRTVSVPLGRARVIVLDESGREISETEVEVPERGTRFVPLRFQR